MQRGIIGIYPSYPLVDIKALGGLTVFMIPRRCASNTVRKALMEIASKDRLNFITKAEIQRLDYLTRVAIVRHPLDRLISCWQFRFHLPVPHCGWDSFVNYVLDTPDRFIDYHLRSISDELIVDRMPDHVIHVERLTEEWEALIGEPPILRRYNCSGKSTVVVTKHQKKMLAIRFEKDLKNFGYDMLDWTGRTNESPVVTSNLEAK